MRAIVFFPGENKHKQAWGSDRPQPQHFSLREHVHVHVRISANTVATKDNKS